MKVIYIFTQKLILIVLYNKNWTRPQVVNIQIYVWIFNLLTFTALIHSMIIMNISKFVNNVKEIEYLQLVNARIICYQLQVTKITVTIVIHNIIMIKN